METDDRIERCVFHAPFVCRSVSMVEAICTVQTKLKEYTTACNLTMKKASFELIVSFYANFYFFFGFLLGILKFNCIEIFHC